MVSRTLLPKELEIPPFEAEPCLIIVVLLAWFTDRAQAVSIISTATLTQETLISLVIFGLNEK